MENIDDHDNYIVEKNIVRYNCYCSIYIVNYYFSSRLINYI